MEPARQLVLDTSKSSSLVQGVKINSPYGSCRAQIAKLYPAHFYCRTRSNSCRHRKILIISKDGRSRQNPT